jgi:formylglycine-generating enzyme required for sulfatase activity
LDQDATARQADGQELLREFLKLEKKSRLPAWLAAGALVIAAVVLGLKFLGAGLLPTADRAGKMVDITNQPAGLSVALNGNATFNVGASGELPLTYQWRVNGRNITGATDSSLRVNGAQTGAAGDYSVVVANGYNSVTSAAATLAVSSQPAASPGSPYPVAGQRWTNSLGMIFIPLAGSKLMLSGYETRVQDYNEFRKARNKPVDHPFFRQDKNHPAIDVNWTEAEAFCAWLTAKEHAAGQLGGSQVYRLPTRSEWCQAIPGYNPNNRFVWGDSFEQMTNGIGNVLKFAREGDHTLPVGSFKVNQFGFADLVGNAAEWLGDSDKMGDSRYIIGGAWDSEDDSDFLVTAPPQIPKNVSREDVGFRCLLDLDPKKPAN